MAPCSPSDASSSCRTFTPACHQAPHHARALAPWLRTSNAASHLQPRCDGLEEKHSSLPALMWNSQENPGKRAAHSSIIPAPSLKPDLRQGGSLQGRFAVSSRECQQCWIYSSSKKLLSKSVTAALVRVNVKFFLLPLCKNIAAPWVLAWFLTLCFMLHYGAKEPNSLLNLSVQLKEVIK